MKADKRTCPFTNQKISLDDNGWVIKDLKVAHTLLTSDKVRAPLIHEFDKNTNSFFLALSHSDENNLPRLKKVLATFFTHKNIQFLSRKYFYSNEVLKRLNRNNWYNLEEEYLFPFIKDSIFLTLGVNNKTGNEILKMISLIQRYSENEENELLKATYHLIFERIESLLREEEISDEGFIYHIKKYNGLTLNERISFIFPFFEMLSTKMTIELPSSTLKNIAKSHELQNQFKENKLLFSSIFEESARLLEKITVHRVAKQNFKIDNIEINKDEKVRIKISEANIDSNVFLNSATFDEKRINSSESLAFGVGLHFCLGKEFMKTISFVVCDMLFNYEVKFDNDYTEFSISDGVQ